MINIGGLALGISTCIFIMLFVADEYSYDRFHENAHRIARVVLKGKISDELITEFSTPTPVSKTLQDEFPEVELGVRLKNYGTPKISYGKTTLRTTRVAFVDPEFFQVFSLPLISGDLSTVLNQPNSVVITKETSRKYFGEENPVGKVLDFHDMGKRYKVSGVMEEVPTNSHFHFDLFATTLGLEDKMDYEWVQSNSYSYLLLQEGTELADLESKLPSIVEKYMGPQIQQALGMSYAEFNSNGNHVGLFLQPLTDIHLPSELTEQNDEIEQSGSIKTIYILSAVALFILVIACINFINLSTAIASQRSREVGVKKVLGGYKGQLILQFLTESTVITVFAMVLSILIVVVALPYFNALSGKTLLISSLLTPKILIFLALIGLAIGVLAGLYPALVLSSFKPISALKGKIYQRSNTQWVRGGLVILQFSISVILIIGTLIADLQMNFILNKDLGYNKDRLLVIRESWILGEKEIVFKQQLEADSRVASITRSGYVPSGSTNNSMYNIYPDANSDSFRRTHLYFVDDQYLETMGMELVAGRNFSNNQANDSSSTIINETAARIFGLGADAVGKVISMGTDLEGGKRDLKIIGVVKDFHFKTLYQSIAPLGMINVPNSGLIVRAHDAELSELIATMKELWSDFGTGEPFNYTVLAESYKETYRSETNLSGVLRVFTMLTIFVALIGLFGLVTFTVEQKVKEIGIRKVLGSSVSQIVSMLTMSFMKLIGVSFLVAFPLGLYLSRQWLQDFSYRIEVPWWVLGAAAILTVVMALITIGLKAVRAGMANPVEALRNE